MRGGGGECGQFWWARFSLASQDGSHFPNRVTVNVLSDCACSLVVLVGSARVSSPVQSDIDQPPEHTTQRDTQPNGKEGHFQRGFGGGPPAARHRTHAGALTVELTRPLSGGSLCRSVLPTHVDWIQQMSSALCRTSPRRGVMAWICRRFL